MKIRRTLVSCFLIFIISLGLGATVSAQEVPIIGSRAYVQNVGWVEYPSVSHTILGTAGEGRKMEAFCLTTSDPNLNIDYQAFVQDIGWQPPVCNGQETGVVGQGKKIEAIRVNLSGPNAGYFDLYYRPHVQDYEWLDWARTGASVGTSLQDYRIEALEIMIVPKGTPAPGSLRMPFVEAMTPEEGVHLKAVNQFRRANGLPPLSSDPNLHAVVERRVHDLYTRYSHFRPNGQRFDQAVKDVYPDYRLNGCGVTENIVQGDQSMAGAAKSFRTVTAYPHFLLNVLNDSAKYCSWASCLHGTMGYAVEWFSGLDHIDFADNTGGRVINPPDLYFQSFIQQVGWTNNVTSGAEIGGGTIDAVALNLSDDLYQYGGIIYKVLPLNSEWQNWTCNGQGAGTTGQNLGIQAIRINLTSKLVYMYDVYYRVNVQFKGWSAWARNGQSCGTEGWGSVIDGIQIILTQKGEIPGSIDKPFNQSPWQWPLPGYTRITSGVGPRWGRHHDGLDIPAPTGTPILAVKSGTVMGARYNGNFGNCVTIEHDSGECVYYAHQSRMAVSPGQHVSRGQVIGYVGSTATNVAHLHYEMYTDIDELISPLEFY